MACAEVLPTNGGSVKLKPRLKYLTGPDERTLVFTLWNERQKTNVLWARLKVTKRQWAGWSTVRGLEFEVKAFGGYS